VSYFGERFWIGQYDLYCRVRTNSTTTTTYHQPYDTIE
jgi:hypothetical protein